MDEKRFVELMRNTIENNNEKLAKMMDDKIQDNNYKIFEYFEERFNKLEQKIIDNGFYFEEHYGKKIDIIFEKLQFNDQIKSIENKKLEKYKKHNDTLLMSHEVRITNLEKAVNSN